jgi:hypothetical protein
MSSGVQQQAPSPISLEFLTIVLYMIWRQMAGFQLATQLLLKVTKGNRKNE